MFRDEEELKSIVQQCLCKNCSDAFGCVEPCARYLAELERLKAEFRFDF